MKKHPTQMASENDEAAALTIPLEKVCWIILKTREFDAKDVSTDPDSSSNASDDQMISVLEDRADDSVEEELTSFINALSEDEQIDLVGLMWLGRDDNTAEDWPSVREEAARVHASHKGQTARYLLGDPMVSDFLEQGLTLLGKSCEDVEIDHL